MTHSASDRADMDGWTAHTLGRADLRDIHWHYRDVIRRYLARKDHDMTDDFTPIEADDELLIEETGDATTDEIRGNFTDNTDDEGGDHVDASA